MSGPVSHLLEAADWSLTELGLHEVLGWADGGRQAQVQQKGQAHAQQNGPAPAQVDRDCRRVMYAANSADVHTVANHAHQHTIEMYNHV